MYQHTVLIRCKTYVAFARGDKHTYTLRQIHVYLYMYIHVGKQEVNTVTHMYMPCTLHQNGTKIKLEMPKVKRCKPWTAVLGFWPSSAWTCTSYCIVGMANEETNNDSKYMYMYNSVITLYIIIHVCIYMYVCMYIYVCMCQRNRRCPLTKDLHVHVHVHVHLSET